MHKNRTYLINDKEEGRHAEGPVAPLVRRLRERAHEARHDHDLVGQDSDEQRGPRHARREQQVGQQQRRRDEPVDVAHVEDLARARRRDGGGAGAQELGLDGHLAEVGAHGEVGDAGHGRDAGRDVVEEAVALRLGRGEAHEDEGRGPHDGAYGEVPVRRPYGDLQVGVLRYHAVGVEGLIS